MVASVTVVAVLGTYLLLATFLSVTAHVAARNVLGDARFDRALLVGPVTAAVSFLVQGGVRLVTDAAATLPPAAVPLATVAVAVAVDAAAIRGAYELETRLAAYVTLIHVVVTVILATVLGGLLAIVIGGAGG